MDLRRPPRGRRAEIALGAFALALVAAPDRAAAAQPAQDTSDSAAETRERVDLGFVVSTCITDGGEVYVLSERSAFTADLREGVLREGIDGLPGLEGARHEIVAGHGDALFLECPQRPFARTTEDRVRWSPDGPWDVVQRPPGAHFRGVLRVPAGFVAWGKHVPDRSYVRPDGTIVHVGRGSPHRYYVDDEIGRVWLLERGSHAWATIDGWRVGTGPHFVGVDESGTLHVFDPDGSVRSTRAPGVAHAWRELERRPGAGSLAVAGVYAAHLPSDGRWRAVGCRLFPAEIWHWLCRSDDGGRSWACSPLELDEARQLVFDASGTLWIRDSLGGVLRRNGDGSLDRWQRDERAEALARAPSGALHVVSALGVARVEEWITAGD